MSENAQLYAIVLCEVPTIVGTSLFLLCINAEMGCYQRNKLL